ncbi:hypothetical protein F5Y15DRAFT_198778 [Xylariaceae sp. FL0016]|nr:hypothetical protein F5Y15DRAFT_198778 [Xylariaceae sp. FL0016]
MTEAPPISPLSSVSGLPDPVSPTSSVEEHHSTVPRTPSSCKTAPLVIYERPASSVQSDTHAVPPHSSPSNGPTSLPDRGTLLSEGRPAPGSSAYPGREQDRGGDAGPWRDLYSPERDSAANHVQEEASGAPLSMQGSYPGAAQRTSMESTYTGVDAGTTMDSTWTESRPSASAQHPAEPGTRTGTGNTTRSRRYEEAARSHPWGTFGFYLTCTLRIVFQSEVCWSIGFVLTTIEVVWKGRMPQPSFWPEDSGWHVHRNWFIAVWVVSWTLPWIYLCPSLGSLLYTLKKSGHARIEGDVKKALQTRLRLFAGLDFALTVLWAAFAHSLRQMSGSRDDDFNKAMRLAYYLAIANACLFAITASMLIVELKQIRSLLDCLCRKLSSAFDRFLQRLDPTHVKPERQPTPQSRDTSDGSRSQV